jgi:hypothetical protein
MKSLCSVFIMKSVVCVQFIVESFVNLDKRNTNKEIVCIKNYQPFLYICILALVLQIYPNFLIEFNSFNSFVEIINRYF